MHKKLKEELSDFFCEKAIGEMANIIVSNNILLRITRQRISKFGDFKPSKGRFRGVISINGNLGRNSSLLVFLHELGHFFVWEKHKRNVAPHGIEWKSIFRIYLLDFVKKGFFHPKLDQDLLAFSANLKSTGLGSPELRRKLDEIDNHEKDVITVFLEDLPTNTLFKSADGKIFRKEEKLRKRFRCYCLDNNRVYLFQPMAEVRPAS